MLKYVCIGLAITVVVFLFFVFCINYDKISGYFKNKKLKEKPVKNVVKKETKSEESQPTFISKKTSDKQAEIQDTVYTFDEFDNKSTGEDAVEETKSNYNSISKTIRNLPPEIKVMLVDNTLKKRDDV